MRTFTIVHVLISLAGVGSGMVVLAGLLRGRRLDRWTAVFLASTVATSVTGFGFPFTQLLPSHIVGALSLGLLALAIFARYARGLAGGWRKTYVVTAVLALYFNVFVLIVQTFLRAPALRNIAPTQSEPPFLLAQAAALVLFGALGVAALLRFRPETVRSAGGVPVLRKV